RIENQIERFAPGFRDCVLARNALSPSTLESMDANLKGGDISGGIMDIRQFAFQIERFAPGFRECVLARNALSPSTLESMDANLKGGDISGGIMDIRQFAF